MAARSGILGLGSRLYPGNMQRIFNKDLTRFMQSLSRERQNRASKRKALLAGCARHTSDLVCFQILPQIAIQNIATSNRINNHGKSVSVCTVFVVTGQENDTVELCYYVLNKKPYRGNVGKTSLSEI